MMENNNKMIKN